MILPSTIVPASLKSPQTLTIYGPPKVGKTSTITALESYLLAELEPNGASFMDCMRIDFTCIEQLDGLKDAIKQNNRPYKYGILDTLDVLEEWCVLKATETYRNTALGSTFKGSTVLELPKGGGYYWLRNEFYKYFHQFRLCFDRAIFLAHVKDAALTSEATMASSKDLDLTGKIKNIACAYSDAIGYMFRDKEGKLKISFATTDSISCGGRCQHLAGKTFEFHQPATLEDWKQIYVD